ncbi:MAG: AAA family ATPase [Mariprofundaceae bacterium]|nr:AAA family ATPase [Mariprofundaceae bacterium]
MEKAEFQSLPAHVRAFRDPEFYPHPATDIIMLQTHISWVFLAGSFAYKIKKPLNLGFLDFSTPEKRLRACRDELNLNRRLAPGIYLDVLPLFQHGDAYILGSNLKHHQNAIDYCVKMVRFDQSDLFDVRLMEAKFDPAWMDQLATTIACFHQHAESSPYIRNFGKPEFLQSHMEASLEYAEQAPGQDISPLLLSDLKRKSRAWFDSLKTLIRQRQARFVKNCHGDLHLKNITLFNNRPTPCDCIEFSDEFRMVDTMNDVAFLVMDCDSRERSDLGYRFLSRYLEQSGDYDGLKLLPLYLSYRAAVRGKVSCLLLDEMNDEPGLDKNSSRELHHDIHHYYAMAAQYLTSEQQPELFIIGGLSGSGKSHLALLALQHMSALIIRSDATRKRIAADHPDLPLYGDKMHKLTYRAMFDAAGKALEAGFSVILDATFLHPASREHAAALGNAQGVPWHFYWLDIDQQTLRAGVGRRQAEGRDISDADLEVLEAQLTGYERPTEPYIEFVSDSNHWPQTSNL